MNEKQTKLEESINSRAEQSYDAALVELHNFIMRSPIGKVAKVKVAEDKYIELRNLFSYQSTFEDIGNGKEAKKLVIEDFEAKEVSELHRKLDSLNYLFN